MRRASLLMLALAALSCSSAGPRLPAPERGAISVPGETALSFQLVSHEFYANLVRRRFNTLDTFNDRKLRQHFQNPDLFFDYYADLAQGFADAHFERSRPEGFSIEEFVFEEATRVRLQVRFGGRDNRPLRADRTALVRRDLWFFSDGAWWIQPGPL